MQFDLEQFFYNSPDPMCIASEDGYFKKVNPAFVDLLGYTELELTSQPYAKFVVDEDVRATHQEAKSLIENGRTLVFENRYRSKDGSIKWLSWRSIMIGSLIYGTARDVTEAKNILVEQIARQPTQVQIQGLSEAIPQMVWTANPNGEVNYFNRRWYDYTGLTQEQTHGWEWTAALHPDDRESCIRKRKQAYLNGRQFEMEYRFRNAADGSYRWHLGRGIPVRDNEGQIVQWFGTCTDIDDQRRTLLELQSTIDDLHKVSQEKSQLAVAEKSARESSKLKSDFLANMSHEIRTPLNGIIGMTELVLETPLSANQKDMLETARESGNSLLALINDLLDFSKIEAGQMAIETIDFDLSALVSEVRKLLQHMAEQKGINLKFELSELKTLVIQSDPSRLRQILFNLIQNAIKFTEKGEVTVKVSEENFGTSMIVLHFSVQDTGIGIRKEEIKEIFNPFNQGDSTTTRKYGGTGLGLSICKKIIEQMQGSLGLETELGKGSTFWFRLAVKKGHSLDTSKTKPTPRFLSSRSKLSGRVLVAEDNQINQRLVRQLLEGRGLSVQVADDGNQVLQMVHKAEFDLILMDCHMPNMDGFTASKALCSDSNPKINKIPIIALTADVSQGIEDKCIQHQIDSYMKKPIDFEAFHKMLDRQFKVANASRNLARPPSSPVALVLDQTALSKLEALNSPGLSDIVLDLTKDYLEQAPEKIGKIVRALEKKEYEQAQAIAHSLKSASAQLGAQELARVCSQIEQSPRQKGLVTTLKKSFAKAKKEILRVRRQRQKTQIAS